MVRMSFADKICISIFVGLVVLSTIMLSYPFIFEKKGVLVSSISNDSACGNVIFENSIITKVNDKTIENVGDFNREIQNSEDSIKLMINGNPRVCMIGENESLNLEVVELGTEKIKFGFDVTGGKEMTLTSKEPLPKNEIDSMLEKISERGEYFQIPELRLSYDDRIKISYLSEDEHKIKTITSPGVMDFKLIQKVKIKNGTGEIILGEDKHEFQVQGDKVIFGDSGFLKSEKFMVEDIEFEVYDVGMNETTFLMKVLDDQDIISAITDGSRIFEQGNNVFGFIFQVELTAGGSDNFEKVTKNQETLMVTPYGEPALKEDMIITLDGQETLRMPIFSKDAGTKLSRLNIIGFNINGRNLAEEKMDRLIAFTNTGRIDELEIVDIKDVPGDEDILKFGIISTIFFATLGSIFNFIKTKNIYNSGLLLILILSSLFLIIGFSSNKIVLLIGIFSCLFFALIRSDVRNKIWYLSVFLLFIVSFGLVISNTAVNYFYVVGIVVASILSSLLFILRGTNLKNGYKYFVLVTSILSGAVFFLMPQIKVVSMIASTSLLINISLTEDVFKNQKKES